MARKKRKSTNTYFINRRVEFIAQAFYVLGIFLFIPAWFMGRDLESRVPLFGMAFLAAIVAFAVLCVPIYFSLIKLKVRPDAARTFLASFAFILVPVMIGGLPIINAMAEKEEAEILEPLILTTYGEPGTEERVNVAGSSTALVEFEDETRRRFPISNSEYHKVDERKSRLQVARKTGLVGLVWYEPLGVAELEEEVK